MISLFIERIAIFAAELAAESFFSFNAETLLCRKQNRFHYIHRHSMKRSKLLSVSILIASVLILSAARNARALRNPRPNKHEEHSAKDALGTQPRQPELTVPLSLFKTTQSALADALRAIRTQEEIAEKQAIAQYEPWYAPAVLAQFGLII